MDLPAPSMTRSPLVIDEKRLAHTLNVDLGPRIAQHETPIVPLDLFARTPVLLSREDYRAMQGIIDAYESTIATSAFQRAISDRAPDIATTVDPGSAGVFCGYDFHITPQGPRLIEVNTNAGGALLNAHLAASQTACCSALEAALGGPINLDELERLFVSAFRNEWLRSGFDRELKSIAIVDDSPTQQPMYPEFVLFQRLFRRHGLEAVIADPRDLTIRGGTLRFEDRPIDLVYNRFCDFMLETPAASVLRSAYLRQVAAITPHPRAHSLLADKSNLALLSGPAQPELLEVSPDTLGTLTEGIPRTRMVTPTIADELWRERKNLFFKPTAGYGSRGAYRGAKLTRRVWNSVSQGGYVAQEFIPPPTISVVVDGQQQSLKYDIRAYTYLGEIQLLTARLYRGQTTNLRTPGGGFAPVIIAEDTGLCCS